MISDQEKNMILKQSSIAKSHSILSKKDRMLIEMRILLLQKTIQDMEPTSYIYMKLEDDIQYCQQLLQKEDTVTHSMIHITMN
jgi:hypothetical protein